MPVGGRREGAGRKPGSVNQMSAHAREEAAKSGELPHEFLLRVSRGEKIGEHEPSFEDRVDAAKAAAPYFAPRFAAATIDLSRIPGGQKRPACELTDEELQAEITWCREQLAQEGLMTPGMQKEMERGADE